MSRTREERQEARSALNTVINSSKRTTGVSSSSPPLGRPSPHTRFLSSSNKAGGGWRVRDGLSWVSPRGASMAGGWKAGGQLCCLLGLSPRWAVIKSRPRCEAFCRGSSGLLPPVSLDVSLRGDVTKSKPVLCLFFRFIANAHSPLCFSPSVDQIETPRTCPESQLVIVNLLGIKHKIRLDFDALHRYTSHSPWPSRTEGSLER